MVTRPFVPAWPGGNGPPPSAPLPRQRDGEGSAVKVARSRGCWVPGDRTVPGVLVGRGAGVHEDPGIPAHRPSPGPQPCSIPVLLPCPGP